MPLFHFFYVVSTYQHPSLLIFLSKKTIPDFSLFMPVEIFSIILLNLNQVYCAECITVYRRWHRLIPQYGRSLWTELEIIKWVTVKIQ